MPISMKKCRFILLLSLLFVFMIRLHAQTVERFQVKLNWQGVQEEMLKSDTIRVIALESGSYDVENVGIPVFQIQKPIFDAGFNAAATLANVVAVPASAEELEILNAIALNADFTAMAGTLKSRENAFLSLTVNPFRIQSGIVEKLVSADVSVALTPREESRKSVDYDDESVLASGNWYKVSLTQAGIYKLTYSDLSSLGMNVASVDPRNIRVYHNGGGVLPELNSESRHDDLVEIPIYVYGESDGKFDANDYILFYARGPVTWTYNATAEAYDHVQNAYDTHSFAFITADHGAGERIETASAVNGTPTSTITEFLDHQLNEADLYNLSNSGRNYYGDVFDGTVSRDYTFAFPNIDKGRDCIFRTHFAGRNFKPASFQVYVNSVLERSYNISVTTSSSSSNYAELAGGYFSVTPTADNMNVTLRHVGISNTTSMGYLDYIAINAWRALKFSGSQMLFRNPEAANVNSIYSYALQNATQQTQVWNVTDPVEPKMMPGNLSSSTFTFNVRGNVENEFIAFDGTSYLTPGLVGAVSNQNLHGIRNIDYLIVTYSGFMDQANMVKNIHASLDPDMTVYVTTPEAIYNEFSCGAVDVTAIRDFCRMLYTDSDAGHELKYLLLLGDASFDYLNRSGTVCFVPSYETLESSSVLASAVTDDYFGCLDENEGLITSSLADIGIGRLPVSTVEQANQMVDKIENYVAKNESSMQPWRNVITFFCDDAESNQFVSHSETFAGMLDEVGGGDMVVDKIYLDAFEQVSTPGGQLAPAVNEAINDRMEKGTLVLNYVGHGGEVQLAEERILERADVNTWRNGPMYPLMITGTCEFSRYDDHTRTSLGEYAFLNQYGGMIAMMTTSRVTFGSENLSFIKGIYNHLFNISGGERLCFGDVYRMAKTKGNYSEKRYVLFGDPALRLVYPKWTVETTTIDGHDPAYYQDTLKALQEVEIAGAVKDLNGAVASNFNGIVYISVYDKEANLTTNGDEGVVPYAFNLSNSIIFNGKTKVVNGRFSTTFTVPRDISYSFGKGRICYYATDYENDAHGSFDDFIIGGFYNNAVEDDLPPVISLHIDDTLFVSGGLTNENPILLAFVEDESGINTTGTGIGHDIVATLSGASDVSYCLNDYFVAELDNHGKGTITYRMQNLKDGAYTLTLKVWDIYNNSSTATIDFVVSNSSGMAIENPICSPNPVTDHTRFSFDHNQVGNNMDVSIQIFDIMGRLVTTIEDRITGTTARTTPIYWDCRSSNGSHLAAGVYVYRIIATNDEGETAYAVSKLILHN